MNVIARPEMSLQEFLAWEAGQELKWEYDGKGPVAVTGGTRGHSRIQRNLISALQARLNGPLERPA